jgi:hypothetical protein
MSALRMSDHAIQRFAQRGFQLDDAEIIMELGAEVQDGYLIRSKDVQEVERATKAFLDRIRRLEGARVVIAGETIVTGYRPSKRKCRELLKA